MFNLSPFLELDANLPVFPLCDCAYGGLSLLLYIELENYCFLKITLTYSVHCTDFVLDSIVGATIIFYPPSLRW